jgi:hypothetical protein
LALQFGDAGLERGYQRRQRGILFLKCRDN